MAFTRLYSGPEPQRINKWLAQAGVCSRREAEDLIGRGLVSIDGERVEDVGRKILPGQTLVLSDAAQQAIASAVSVIVHKPRGVVSANPERGQTEAAQLLTRHNRWGEGPNLSHELRPAPLGRLDKDSRGLLLLSDDGVLAKAVIGPESQLDKEYRVAVMGEITEAKLGLLRHGLELDGRKLRPAEVEVIGDQRLQFILHEGRNRQIRRMCELVELKVVDLFRSRLGPIDLGDMPEGRWRPLSEDERALLIASGMT